MSSGEEKAWNILRERDPAEVCRNTIAHHDDATGVYLLKSFGMDISIEPVGKRIYSDAPEGDLLLNKLGYFSRLAILCYLISAKNIAVVREAGAAGQPQGRTCFFQGDPYPSP